MSGIDKFGRSGGRGPNKNFKALLDQQYITIDITMNDKLSKFQEHLTTKVLDSLKTDMTSLIKDEIDKYMKGKQNQDWKGDRKA